MTDELLAQAVQGELVLQIWLDDCRVPPDMHWYWPKTVEEAIAILECVNLDAQPDICISSDHDLGEGEKDGIELAKYLETCEATGKQYNVTEWHVHSANPVGRKNIVTAMESFERFTKTRKMMTEHIAYKCPPGCEERHCVYCDGGLFSCTVCKCAEGTLPTECPGVRVDGPAQDAIYGAVIDYKGGEWVMGVKHPNYMGTPEQMAELDARHAASLEADDNAMVERHLDSSECIISERTDFEED